MPCHGIFFGSCTLSLCETSGMNLKEKYKDDIAVIMAKINHNGGDLWTTKDRRVTASHKTSSK